jgi:hypothetical protein
MLALCHKCPSRSCGGRDKPGCAGAMLCTVSGRNIIDHAANGDCPLGKFNTASLPQSAPTKPPRRLLPKPGDALAAIIKSATGIDANGVDPTTAKTCGCKTLAREMNKNGWLWCWRNRQKICEHLAAEAKKRGIDVSPTLPSLIREAFRGWRSG